MSATYANHGDTSAPPNLSVYQAWWAMEGIGENGREWTREQKLEQIAQAGFEGVLVFDDFTGAEGETWRDLLSRFGLRFAAGTIAARPDELYRDIARAGELGATFVNLQTMDYFLRGQEAIDLFAGAIEAGEKAGVPALVETHRGCVTQDLLRTLDYVEALPDMRMAVDLSHFVVAGQLAIAPEETWPIDPRIDESFAKILQRGACIHGRIGTGHQVQIDIGPDGEHPVAEYFQRWWGQAMSAFRSQAGPGDVMPFVCELGPPAYSITYYRGPNKGSELSDRWEQAQVLRRVAQRTWEQVAS